MVQCLACGQAAEEAGYCEPCGDLAYARLIQRVCIRSASREPTEIARQLMAHPKFPLAGQAHHPLVAGSILAAIRNSGTPVEDAQIQQAIKRADSIPSGFCAGFGADAAAIACGIAIAVLEKTTVKAEHAPGRTLAHLLTGQAMLAIAANSGNRCCKRSVFTVLEVASTFLRGTRGFALERPSERVQCEFAAANPLCNGVACRFWPAAIAPAAAPSSVHLPVAP